MKKENVLAVVGEKVITQNDVDTILNNIDPQQAMKYYSEDGKKRLIEELVNQELLYLDALDHNLQNDELYIAEVERLKTSLLKQYAINKAIANADVDESELKAYYDNNPAQFKAPESLRGRHILVEGEESALKVIDEIKGGLSFEEAANKYSKCPSNANGGDLGYFTKGRMVPEFEAAAFDLKLNELSQPVKTQFGYHIIEITDKKSEATRSFDDVKDQLSQQLLAQKQQQLFLDKVEALKEKYPVELHI
ncbi:peptidylprolyl isomerase [Alkaliphilus serpentinus]|uniref:Peptidylprolyl isomerase n=1 Tax=Alkaliphilus serpentinus TaxID=1482731 RepID=A0A833MAK8_9FIRM|nr:peptidylprolyl isomerase [Alkaliphilus serpentinus]KAB3531149.1 peptidylprolyl isomerase [Alkaliphilus serpentinus]